MIHLAICGIGGYGWSVLGRLRRLSRALDCRLVAAADSRLDDFPERRRRLLQHAVALFDDAPQMLERLQGRCDGVYIATGIDSHMPLTAAAAQAGCHVLLEKPPAATVQEVDAMQRALDEAGQGCLVGFQALHSGDIRMIKDRVVSGRLGAVRSLACSAGLPRTQAYYDRNGWAGRLRCREAWVLDGPATNAMSHQIANMLLLASPEAGRLATPIAVRAELYAAGPISAHDTAAIEIRTAEGPTLYFLGSHCTGGWFSETIHIDAEKAEDHWHKGLGGRIAYRDGTEEPIVFDAQHQDRMVANFVRFVHDGDGTSLRCPLSESRKVMLALDGAHESSGRIHRIGPEHRQRLHEGAPEARTVVDGLDGMLAQAARSRVLLSDLRPAPPWATATGSFDLTGYTTFPRRFRCD